MIRSTSNFLFFFLKKKATTYRFGAICWIQSSHGSDEVLAADFFAFNSVFQVRFFFARLRESAVALMQRSKTDVFYDLLQGC